MIRTRLIAGVSLGAVIAVLQTGGAYAQAKKSELASDKIETITVTAQHRSENLQTTPIAISALTSSALQSRQLTKMTNLSAAVPSLQIMQVSADPAAIAIDMRGDAELSGGLVTSESPVAIYIDDVYQSRLSASNLDLGDVERIEVLRGPQGTLYGRNSMTGAIKIITRKPDGSTWFNSSIGYGSYDHGRYQLSGGMPVTSHIAVSLAGLYDTKDGWQYDTALKHNVGGDTTIGLHGGIGLYDTGRFTAMLRGYYTHIYGQGQYMTPVNPITNQALVPFGDTRSPRQSYTNVTQATGSLTLGYKYSSALDLRSITALETTTDAWGLDFSGGLVAAPLFTPTAGFFRANVDSAHQFTEEVQALGNLWGDKLHYIVGFFYYNEVADQAITDTIGPGGFGFGFPASSINVLPTTFSTNSRSVAGYAQADYHATRKLTLTAGIRYSKDKKSFSGAIQQGLFNFTYADVNTTQSNSIWTPKLTARYQFTHSWMSYVTVARGYRAGGFNGLAVFNPIVFGAAYQPETVWSYEAGNKIDFWGDRAQLNGDFYYEQMSNLQMTAQTSGGNFPIQNAAQAHVYGLELEGVVKPLQGLSLYGNLALTEDGYDQLDPTTAAAQAGASQLPLVSKVQFQIGGSYMMEPAFLKGGVLTLNADYDHRSHRWSDATQASVGYIPDANYVNASISVQSPDGHWELIASGRNLTDEHYYFDGIAFIPGAVSAKFASPPATWMMTLKYNY